MSRQTLPRTDFGAKSAPWCPVYGWLLDNGYVRLGADLAATLHMSEWRTRQYLDALSIPVHTCNWRGTRLLCVAYQDAIRAVRIREPP